MYKFDHFLEIMLADHFGKFPGVMILQDHFPNKIIDFQQAEKLFSKHEDYNNTSNATEDMSASIVCFPLYPKPHHVTELAWIKKYWKVGL